MNRSIIILALETLREQVVDTLETTNDYDITHQSEQQLAYVDEELNRMKLRVRSKDFARWLQYTCLLYTSPSPRDRTRSRMPSSA